MAESILNRNINQRYQTDEANFGQDNRFNNSPYSIRKSLESLEKELEITKKIAIQRAELLKTEKESGKESKKYIENQKELSKLEQERANLLATAQKNLLKIADESTKAEYRRLKAQENLEKLEKRRAEKAVEFARRQAEIDSMAEGDAKKAAQKQLNKDIKDASKETAQEEKAIAKKNNKYFEEMAKALKEQGRFEEEAEARATAESLKEEKRAEKQEVWENYKKKLLQDIKNNVGAGLTENARIARQILENDARYNSRLQGYSKSYKEIVDKISTQIGLNPFITQENTVNNLNSLLERGIAYNIEQRSFLATVSDKVAATFDKQNETLERLIRLQQSDSTAARLGLEASLTELFNDWFEDTSYLASNTFDQVTSALIDAEAQMTRNQAVEFEYTVQKWLGSLSSLGLSSSAVTGIAGGLGQLASGNISALSGSPLQTLFALSSSKAGLSYSDMLIRSLDGSSTNELLKAMVTYLKEIAGGENQVVKSAYGKIFGLSQSDFRALQNIKPEDITNIWKLQSNYSQAIQEVNEQLTYSNLVSRTTIGAMVQNIISNFKYSWGSQTASRPIVGTAVQINDLINQITGGSGIRLPWITTLFGGFGLDNSINNIITAGGQAITLLESIFKIGSAFGGNMGLDLSAWDASEYTRRGSGFKGIASGLRTGTSMSAYIASGSTSDMESSTLEEQGKKAKETRSGVFGEEEERDFNKSKHMFDDLFSEDSSPLIPVTSRQDKLIATLTKDDKGSIYAILCEIEKAVKNPKAQLNIEGSKFATQLRAALQNIIAGGTEIDGIPSEMSIGEALIGIYDILNGNSSKAVKVSVDSVSRTVPGFNGIGNKIAVTGIY